MGCATSKIDDLPAVVLCRDRLTFLQQSLHHRYSLAEAHVAYIHSLTSLGLSLHRYFHSATTVTAVPATVDSPSSPSSGHLSHSASGSHLHFDSDSDDDHHDHHESGSGSDSPLHHHQHHEMDHYPVPTGFNPYPDMHFNYMKRHVTPSVTYQQKPLAYQTVQYGGDNYGNPYGYMNYGPGPGPGPGPYGMAGEKRTTEDPPPSPPPPPSSSGWDFLNFFESIEESYPPYTPSRDSREVREEEGIPDLEDEDEKDYDHHDVDEVVKEVHGNQKLKSIDETENHIVKRVADEGVGPSGNAGKPSSSSAPEEDPVEYEVHMVDKKVVGEEGKMDPQSKGGKSGFRSVFDVVREIQVQFERASACGHEIDKLLEVGKLRYHRKNAYQVSKKMLNVITPSLPSKESEASLDPDEVMQLRATNLSASLQKLYLWEKKLFEEVKAEEKMRVLHDRKVQKLKRLDERGAEAQKIESTTNAIRNLSTKIRIAIQVVDKISVKINKVRDEELWPQLNELIQGLSRMWKSMLECHHSQCQAMDGARGLDAIAFPKATSDTQLEASLQLEHDLINWTCRFTEWVGAQKGFVRALNSWLFKCLIIEPEETADGVAPFSPGRAGAPPVFVICNQWNQSLDRISETSEKEVVESMRVFAMMIWHLRERDKGEMRQRMTANREMERKVKNLEREDMKMQKEIQALDKKMMLLSSGGSDAHPLSGHVVYQSDTSSKNSSFQAGLMRIFEAMDQFTSDSVKVYEELLQRTEEVVRERNKVS